MASKECSVLSLTLKLQSIYSVANMCQSSWSIQKCIPILSLISWRSQPKERT